MKFEAIIELTSREGNMNLPQLPRGELEAFLLDTYTGDRVRVKFDTTNVIKICGKTYGSLQWLSTANLLVWSSFEPSRFTLYVRRLNRQTTEQMHISKHILGRNDHCMRM